MSNGNDNFPAFGKHPADPDRSQQEGLAAKLASLEEAGEIKYTKKYTNKTSLVAELVSLAEAGEIKYTAKYIKKASQDALEKIKRDYDRKQLDEANEFISDNLISKFSELVYNLNMIDNVDEMGKELTDNQLLKRDLKNIIGRLTPYIPLVGLLCGGVIVGKHIFKGSESKSQAEGGAAQTVGEDE